MPQTRPIRSLLVANRGEIAIRVMRAASELGIRTVSVYSQEDRFSLHRMKADESYLVGDGQGRRSRPTSTSTTSSASRARRSVDAVHPGYGFLVREPGVRRGVRRGRARLRRPAGRRSCVASGNKVDRARARRRRRRSGDAGHAAAAA